MKRCIDCERWLNCDRAIREIICDDFKKLNRNITRLDKVEEGNYEFKKIYEENR